MALASSTRAHVLAFVLAWISVLASPSLAQVEDPKVPVRQEIQDALTDAGDDPASEPATELIRTLRSARDAVDAAELARQNALRDRSASASAPERIEQIRTEIAALKASASTAREPVESDETLQDLETRLNQAEADLQSAQAELDALKAEGEQRQTRLAQIPTEIASAQTRVNELREEWRGPIPEGMSLERQQARAFRIGAQLEASRESIDRLRAERDSYNARTELLNQEILRAENLVQVDEQKRDHLRAVVQQRRAEANRRAVQEANASDRAAGLDVPALRPVALQVQMLVDDISGDGSVGNRSNTATTELTSDRTRLAERRNLAEDIFQGAQLKPTGVYGQSLQTALRSLRDENRTRQRLANEQEALLLARVRIRELNRIANEPTDIDTLVADLVGASPRSLEPHRELARRLFEQRRTLLAQSLKEHQDYAATLVSLIEVLEEYLEQTEQLDAFIRDRVFWVRSIPSDQLVPNVNAYLVDTRWLTDADDWATGVIGAASGVVPGVTTPRLRPGDERPAWEYACFPVLAGLLLVLAVVAHRRLVAMSRRALPDTGHFRRMSPGGTARQLVIALASALPVPAALWVVAVWLGSASTTFDIGVRTPAPLAVAGGLERAAHVLLGLGILMSVVRRGAVGATEFRWTEPGLAHIRTHLRWFIPLGTVGAAVIQTFELQGDSTHTEAIGRTTLVFSLLAVAAFQGLAFKPTSPFIVEYLKRNRGGMIEWTRWLWYPMLLLVPIGLAMAAAAGFVYTALQIQLSIGNTYLLVVGVIVAQAMVLRSLQLARRHLAVEAAKARMAAAKAEAEAEATRQGQPEISPDAQPEPRPPGVETSPERSLSALGVQSRKVIRVITAVVLTIGLYGVWSDVLPALRWFEKLEVFPEIRYVEDLPPSDPGATVVTGDPTPSEVAAPVPSTGSTTPQVTNDEPAPQETSPVPTRVTVADIGFAILLLILTVSASRNLPGFLEITVLGRLPLDAATRYAVYSVSRYALIIVGVVAISSALSIPWQSTQWLAAALTFGLAFGLQEIFANFVSGLIMLFEQPVRVGDTVTVGTTSGTVSKIRMRATTIVDWDNKELIIPNKNFITGEVVNWTLSNPSCRVVVPVGIAYGSDTELARELLLNIASESPNTLADPPARALFLGFGDNTLNFELRVYIESIEHFLSAKSDLHFRIDRAFRDNDIEISFPQRDLHLRSVDPSLLGQLGDANPTKPAAKAD